LLEVGTAGHWSIAVAASEIGEDAPQLSDVFVQHRQSIPDLQDDGRVHDVLGCRTPVDVAPRIAAHFDQLVNERQDWVPDDFGFMSQQIKVQCIHA
jgi:hypothetical protein